MVLVGGARSHEADAMRHVDVFCSQGELVRLVPIGLQSAVNCRNWLPRDSDGWACCPGGAALVGQKSINPGILPATARRIAAARRALPEDGYREQPGAWW